MAVHGYSQRALEWKVQTSKNGVMVMKSSVPGSEWDLVCGDTVVEDATVAQLLAFLTDDTKVSSTGGRWGGRGGQHSYGHRYGNCDSDRNTSRRPANPMNRQTNDPPTQ